MKFFSKKFLAVASIATAALVSTPALAVTTEYVINFDELPNASIAASYTSPNGLFQILGSDNTFNVSSDSKCGPAQAGNGYCMMETTNGASNTLSHRSTVTGPFGAAFDFLGFYFSLTGANNFVTITNNLNQSLTFADKTSANNSYLIDAETGAAPVGDVKHNNGYFVDLTGLSKWEGVTSIAFSYPKNKQALIDCIRVDYSGNTSTASTACLSVNDDGGTGFDVPLPASLPLLLAGVAGFGVIRRKKHKIS
ncbi:VPLPA-CTERM sorting domain-containing protein [Pseudooceanicola onchidii]|uniref:VPLPA-CTERM sorting domain-containing protein n=1 Tax=Pseudooceanicola onchidii TaxID=2562279 RepID=UPI0010AAE03A|nr:VPLPA-CTERM sorting domain-containing protein [Pseudooceanicola onchidii]